MNCSQARIWIALWVGGDIDDAERSELDQHVSDCADCQQHSDRMKSSFRPLEKTAQAGSTVPFDERLWLGIASALESMRRYLPQAGLYAAFRQVVQRYNPR